MEKKYKLLKTNKKTFGDKTLFQIKALVDFSNAKKGEKGGYIEKESNLAHSGDAWVSGDALVYGDALVSGDAWVSGNARIFGDARISGNAWVYGDAWVSGNARIFGDARISGDAWVSGDARVYGNARVSIRADLKTNCDFELPRILINKPEKLKQLAEFLKKLEV